MLNFFMLRRLVQTLILLLCVVTLATGFFYFVSATHAASPKIIPGPPIQCLNVSFSNVGNQRTVFSSNPPGGGVAYDLTLYVSVTYSCPTNFLITQIQIVSPVNIQCSSGVGNVPPIVFHGPNDLYPGGGYGNTYSVVDKCIVFENGVPARSIVPTHIIRTISATGLTTNNNVRQQVTSNTKTLHVW